MIRASRIPAWFRAQALTVAPALILVLPERINDAALIAHEQVHAAQQREHGWLKWWAKYLLRRDFRQAQEVAAYRVQIRHGASFEGCARNLATMYRLGIDVRTARMLLA